MEAIVGELVSRWPDRIQRAERASQRPVDWQDKCDDQPAVAHAILKLVQDSKHLRDAAA